MKSQKLKRKLQVFTKDKINMSFEKRIIEDYTRNNEDTSFFVGSIDDMIHRCKEWKWQLHRVQPYYAVKCNEHSVVVETLKRFGIKFDCASKIEIQKVLSLGVSPKDIIYANPAKQRSFLHYAKTVNVDLMTFDSEFELLKIHAIHPEARLPQIIYKVTINIPCIEHHDYKRKVKEAIHMAVEPNIPNGVSKIWVPMLILRIKPHVGNVQLDLSKKFGCCRTRTEHLLQTAKHIHLNVVGISFHVGSGCKDTSVFPKAIEMARSIFDFAQTIGFDMHILDIGGGFPGRNEEKILLQNIFNGINISLDKHFPPNMEVQILAEPGRYFVTSAFTLFTCIIGKEHITSEDIAPCSCHDSDLIVYTLSDGFFGSFNGVLTEHSTVTPRIITGCKEDSIGKRPTMLRGPTTREMDFILHQCQLPNLQVGDWLAFDNTGAYSMSVASQFSGIPFCPVHWVISHKCWMLMFGEEAAMAESAEDIMESYSFLFKPQRTCKPVRLEVPSKCGLLENSILSNNFKTYLTPAFEITDE